MSDVKELTPLFEKSRGRSPRWSGQPALRFVGLGRDGTSHGTYESRFVPIPSGQACVQKKLVKQSDATKTASWITNDALRRETKEITSFKKPKNWYPFLQGPTALFAVQQGVLVPCDRRTFDNQGPVPERPINVNPGLTFCSVFVFYIPMHFLG